MVGLLREKIVILAWRLLKIKARKKVKTTMIDKQAYIKNKSVSCPFCAAESIHGGFVDIEAGKAFQETSCAECGEDWEDVYQLVDVIAK